MASPVFQAGLELRDAGDGSKSLSASFPYNSLAVLNSGGGGRKPRKEQFAPGAFSYAIDDPERDIHLLIGHDYGKPLASKKAGTLSFKETAAALVLTAIIEPALQESSWYRDFAASYAAGLVGGISPGFRVPPSDVVPDAEKTEEEDPKLGKALIRTIMQAVLFEMSLVTRPAYPETEVDLRQLDSGLVVPAKPAAYRWR